MIVELAANLYRIKIPLPNNPLQSINSYLLTSAERNLIIDTGMNRPECFRVLEHSLDHLAIDLEQTDFFITHFHADHSGLVSQFKSSNSCIYCSSADSHLINLGRHERYWADMRHFMGQNGFPYDLLEEATNTHPLYLYGAQLPLDFTLVDEGSLITLGDFSLQVISTPGHTPGHLCLYEPNRRLFFSGDHLLNDITPNITLFNHQHNSLQEYLRSLHKILELDIEHVLPGHRKPFQNHSLRINELQKHHQKRMEEIILLLQGKVWTGYEVASAMTWDLTYKRFQDFPVQQKWFATGEALSHLQYLRAQGQIDRIVRKDDSFDGTIYFRTSR